MKYLILTYHGLVVIEADDYTEALSEFDGSESEIISITAVQGYLYD